MRRIIRLALGGLIALVNWFTRGPKMKRATDQQSLVNQQSAISNQQAWALSI